MAYYDNYCNRGSSTKFMKYLNDRFNKHTICRIINYFGHEEKINILEIGGGKGEFASLTSKHPNIHYFALEPNAKLAKSLSKYGKVVEEFIPPIPFKDSSYDAIYMSNVLEHIEPSRINETFREINRALKLNGLIIIKAPNHCDMKEFFWDCDYTHQFATTKNRLFQLLSDSHFEIFSYNKMRLGINFPLALIFLPLNLLLKYFIRFFDIKYSNKLYKLYLSSSEQFIIYGRKSGIM